MDAQEQATTEQVDTQATENAEATNTESTNVEAPTAPVAPVAPATDVIPTGLGQQKDYEYKDENGNVLRTYKFQFSTVEEGMRVAELASNDPVGYRKTLIKKIIVTPEVRAAGIEWFDTHKGLWEVTNAADQFLGAMLDGVRG